MKVAVTAWGSNLCGPVHPHFELAPGCVLLHIESGQTEYRETPRSGGSESDAGQAAAERIVDWGVDVLFTGDCGPAALRALEAAGVRVYTALAGPILLVLARWQFRGARARWVSMAPGESTSRPAETAR